MSIKDFKKASWVVFAFSSLLTTLSFSSCITVEKKPEAAYERDNTSVKETNSNLNKMDGGVGNTQKNSEKITDLLKENNQLQGESNNIQKESLNILKDILNAVKNKSEINS